MDWVKYGDLAQLALAQLWSGVAVALLVYQLGSFSKGIALKEGWRGTEDHPSWYDITMRVQPMAAGALVGLIPFPTLSTIESIGAGSWTAPEVVARCGWFMLWGACCGQVYETIKFGWSAIRRRLGSDEKARASRTSDPAKDDTSDPGASS